MGKSADGERKDGMSETKEAAPGVQTENGNGQILFDGFKPDPDCTIEGRELESFLLPGQQNGIPAEKLAKMLGLKDTRQLRIMVQKAREGGSVILSGEKGYYLPHENPIIAAAERKACAIRLKAMGLSLLRVARQIER